MPPTIGLPGYLTEHEAAAQLGYSLVHLRRLRCQGVGPTYIRRGRAAVYTVKDLEWWLEARRVDPEAS